MNGLPFKQLPVGGTEEIFPSTPYNPPRTNITPVTTGRTQTPSIDPISLIEDDVKLGQREIVSWFDGQRIELDQAQLEPEQYLRAIDQLRQQARNMESELHAKANARMNSMDQIVGLMEEGLLQPHAGQRALWRIGGLDDEVINAMLPQTKPVNWMSVHADNVAQQRRLYSFINEFTIYKNNLYRADTKGNPLKDQPATPEEMEQWNMSFNLIDELQRQEREEIFPNLTPLNQSALRLQRVVQPRAEGGLGIKTLKAFAPLITSFHPAVSGIVPTYKLLKSIKETTGIEKTVSTKPRPIFMKKPSTDEVIVSYDNGQSWNKVR